MMKRTVGRLFWVGASVVAVALVGCVPEVIDHNDGRADQNLNGNEGKAGSGASGSTPQPQPAVAMTRAQLDDLWEKYWNENDPSGSTSSSGGGGNLDPDDLFVRLSDLGASCGSPTTELSCGHHWSVSIALPPAYQAPGVYDLEDPNISAYSGMSETGELYSSDPEDCGYGGGSLGPGTIEITAITATEVQFVLTMDPSYWDSDPSGVYSAPRCQN